jgi:hypothetical protein
MRDWRTAPRVGPGGEHQVQLGRGTVQKHRDRGVHLGAGNDALVIQHERQGSVCGR